MKKFLSFVFLAALFCPSAFSQGGDTAPVAPKILTMPPSNGAGSATDRYYDAVIWGLRDTPCQEAQALNKQLAARMKWVEKMQDGMDAGTIPMDKALYNSLNNEISDWFYFYMKLGEIISQHFCRVKLQCNDKGQWYFQEAFPTFKVGSSIAGIPESNVGVDGHTLENHNHLVSLNDRKKPYRFGHIVNFPNQPSVLQPEFLDDEDVAVAKRDVNLATNAAILFQGFALNVFDKGTDYYNRFQTYYNKALLYIEAVNEALANNTPGNLEFKPMPVAGGLNSSMKAQALAIEKSIAKEVVDCIITSDSWEVQTNAAGVPVRRVIYGYSIVQMPEGKMATRVSWSQDYQGGSYGALRSYGTGTESFYVK